jgi:hypothetical protein
VSHCSDIAETIHQTPAHNTIAAALTTGESRSAPMAALASFSRDDAMSTEPFQTLY